MTAPHHPATLTLCEQPTDDCLHDGDLQAQNDADGRPCGFQCVECGAVFEGEWSE